MLSAQALEQSGLPPLGSIIDGKYRLEAALGQGGMAVVYRATQVLTHREVALKWMLPRIARDARVVERFLREARAAASIDHPNVVQIFDVGKDVDSFYIVMELLQGETLRARLARGPMLVEEALAVMMPLLGALGAAHKQGTVHRDLKPENIILRRHEDGRLRSPKLLDFGISKLTHQEAVTLTGWVVGTPYYLSPEQMSSSKLVGPPTDIYQCGVMLYEMLTARKPYDKSNYEALIFAILTEDPTPLALLRPDLPPGLMAVIERAMSREIERRHPNVQSLAIELMPFGGRLDEQLQSGVLEQTSRVPEVTAAASRSRRFPVSPGGGGSPRDSAVSWLLVGISGLASIVSLATLALVVALWLRSEHQLRVLAEPERTPAIEASGAADRQVVTAAPVAPAPPVAPAAEPQSPQILEAEEPASSPAIAAGIDPPEVPSRPEPPRPREAPRRSPSTRPAPRSETPAPIHRAHREDGERPSSGPQRTVQLRLEDF